MLEAAATPFRTYGTETYWQKYQGFFPARARVSAADAPLEEWFPWSGASIHVDRFPREGSPLTVIVVHGAGGYGRLFAPVGKLLQTAGYEVAAPDMPGYGLTVADPSMVSYEAWVRLLTDFIEHEYQRLRRPIVLFGGSVGGYLSYLAAARSDRVAGIIATTLADPRLPLVKEQFAKNKLILKWGMPMLPLWARLMGDLKLPIRWFTKMDAMSNDPALNQLVIEDPFGGGSSVPIRFMQSIFAVTPAIEPERFDRCPVLLVHPGSDRWTDVASSRCFFDQIKGEKKLVLLENCGHFPVEEPGITQLEREATAFLASIAEKAGGRG